MRLGRQQHLERTSLLLSIFWGGLYAASSILRVNENILRYFLLTIKNSVNLR